ncbi:MAG TPA: Rieske 2Fe-2S domain-containing protein [Steroidobacteraceae bacterium]|nr:Rieske 2Fe-2S domain-containing protein [Steroidobacteraceae bacterium]
MTDSEFVRVAAVKDLPPGRMRSYRIAGRDIVLCATRERGGYQVFALDNICTHALARMSEGRLKGVRLICPMHGAAFDVRDGSVCNGPATQALVVHRVRIVEGVIEVALNPAAPPQPLE